MSKLKLYLDDVRTPLDDSWVVVRNYDEFVETVTRHGLHNFDVISLDHDLGEGAMVEYYTNVKNNFTLDYNNIEEKTGMDCTKFLIEYCMDNGVNLPLVYVHSANPIGSANMMGYINNYLMNCRLPQTCVRVNIPHTVDESHLIPAEVRKAKWDRTNNNKK
jgi:hypothetical protein